MVENEKDLVVPLKKIRGNKVPSDQESVKEKSLEVAQGEETQELKENKGEEFTKWDYGHLTFQCFKCGHLEILQHDIGEDLILVLPITDKHEWRLVCPRCKNTMRLFWQKSPKEKPKVEEVEQVTTKRKKSKADESKKKSKEK